VEFYLEVIKQRGYGSIINEKGPWNTGILRLPAADTLLTYPQYSVDGRNRRGAFSLQIRPDIATVDKPAMCKSLKTIKYEIRLPILGVLKHRAYWRVICRDTFQYRQIV